MLFKKFIAFQLSTDHRLYIDGLYKPQTDTIYNGWRKKTFSFAGKKNEIILSQTVAD